MFDEMQTSLPAILIPGFSGGAFLSVASELVSKGFPVIVACGEGDAAARRIAGNAGCIVVEAPAESAIHAGFEYFHREMAGLPGIVCVDPGDGYSAMDILAVAYVLAANPSSIVVAARAANGELRRRERIVRFIAGRSFIVHGRTVRDPWTGLAGFPSKHMADFVKERGDGREYLLNILLMMQRHGIRSISVPVGVKYRPKGGSGLLGSIKDILRILFLPLKFISASLTVTGLDYLVFLLLLYVIFPGHWVFALLAGRTTGGVAGYLLNRNIVFRHKNDTWRKELKSALQFTLLFLFNLGASISIVYLLHDVLLVNEVVARLVTDAFLFILSFTVQREIIFRRKAPAAE